MHGWAQGKGFSLGLKKMETGIPYIIASSLANGGSPEILSHNLAIDLESKALFFNNLHYQGDAKLKISSNICSHLLRAQNIQNTHVQEFCLNGSSSRLKFDTEISIDWLGTQVSLPLDWACAAVEFSGGWGHERGKPMLWYKSILVKRCHLERSQRVFCMYTSLSGFSEYAILSYDNIRHSIWHPTQSV